MLSIHFDLRVGDVGYRESIAPLRGGTDLGHVQVTFGAYARLRQADGSMHRHWLMLLLSCVSN